MNNTELVPNHFQRLLPAGLYGYTPIKLVLIVCCILLISCEATTEEKSFNAYIKNVEVKALKNKLETLIPPLMVEENIPGISISIVTSPKEILTKSFGITSVKSNTPVDNTTLFEFASLSKPVFALAVLQLADNSVIDLDHPLYNYLVFPAIAKDERHKSITAHTVLNHTTGLPNWAKQGKVEFAFTPAAEFQYSGLAYYYLQKVIEELTGKTLQKIVDEEVFVPLNMTNSSFVWNDKFQGQSSAGHNSKGNFSRLLNQRTEGVSASSLISTTEDYAKFLAYILNAFKQGNPLIQSMVAPVVAVKNDGEWGQLSWALGWGIEETSEGNNIWHWGNNDEFRSLVVANLERGLGMVYVANSESGLKPVSDIIQYTIGGIHPLTRFEFVH